MTGYLCTYRSNARRITSVTVSSRSAALVCAAVQRSSAMRMPRMGVLAMSAPVRGEDAVDRVDVGVGRPCRSDALGGFGVVAGAVADGCGAKSGALVVGGVGGAVGAVERVHGVPSRLVYEHSTGCSYTRQGGGE